MKTILIVEDDERQRINLKRMMSEIDICIYEAEDKEEALNICNRVLIDIFIVDIELKSTSGLDFALELRKIHKYELSWIIFLTTHVEYLTQAFKQVHCYDYIIKPYGKEEVLCTIKKLIYHVDQSKAIINESKHIVFGIRNGIEVKVYIHEIIFIEIKLRTCFIHTINGVYKTNKLSLKKLIEIIDSEDIIQSHRAFLVNINYIRKIESIDSKIREIYFENCDDTALLSYNFKNAVLDKFK